MRRRNDKMVIALVRVFGCEAFALPLYMDALQEGGSMTTSEIVAGVLNSEAILLVCAILLVAATALYLEYIIRRWSWIPRRKQRKAFGERW